MFILHGHELSNELHHVTYLIMSNVCSEFRGWFKSFTKIETCLIFLQSLFLILLISTVTFLVLHFLVCLQDDHEIDIDVTITDLPFTDNDTLTTSQSTQSTVTSESSSLPSERSTLPKDIECTWTPSRKTKATTHYYESGDIITMPPPIIIQGEGPKNYKLSMDSMESDDNIVGNAKKGWLLALVKIQHPQDVLFGCTLTIVSIQWTLTAASCIEAIEEVDTLDYFVMVEKFGEESGGVTHELSEVIMHPLYQGVNKSYDLVAIKSEDRLLGNRNRPIRLPTLLDVALLTLGERLSVLGFGKLSLEEDPIDRRVREVFVFKLAAPQCPGDTWAARHLGRPGAAWRSAVGAGTGAMCAGRAGGGRSCPCAGAPLLAGNLLLGIMSDNGACGLACRPAFYVSVALRRDWLTSVLDDD